MVNIASVNYIIILYDSIFKNTRICKKYIRNKSYTIVSLFQLFCPKNENGLWPETRPNTCTRSDPLCINGKNEIVERCCSTQSKWQDDPNCVDYQITMKNLNPCPVGFHNTGSFCYTVIEKTTYPPKCPNPHIMFFEDYIEHIDENIFPIWMPVERDRSYGIGEKM